MAGRHRSRCRPPPVVLVGTDGNPFAQGDAAVTLTEKEKEPDRPAEIVAGVDIGSNTIRMVLAEVSPDGVVSVLEQLHQGIRLGQDTFRRGRLAGPTMQAAIAILREYRRILDTYRPRHLRAVATSAGTSVGVSAPPPTVASSFADGWSSGGYHFPSLAIHQPSPGFSLIEILHCALLDT